MRRLLAFPTTTNLIDTLRTTGKEQYNQLWRFVVLVLTIMPTTVECGQSFSCFKRTAHINMTEENAKNLLFTKLNLYETSFNLDLDRRVEKGGLVELINGQRVAHQDRLIKATVGTTGLCASSATSQGLTLVRSGAGSATRWTGMSHSSSLVLNAVLR